MERVSVHTILYSHLLGPVPYLYDQQDPLQHRAYLTLEEMRMQKNWQNCKG